MRVSVIVLSLAIVLSSLLYFLFVPYSQKADDIVIALRDDSFLPIKPPSKSHIVGSIYYIDPDQGKAWVLCSPHNEISGTIVHESRSADLQGTFTSNATYSSKIGVTAEKIGNGKSSVDDQRKITVSFKLTDVILDEIDVEAGKGILDNMMNRKDCSDGIENYWRLGGYICQDTQLLAATAVFERDQDANTIAGLDLDTQNALASQIEAKTGVRLTTGEGRSTSGERLQWAMQLPPLCITPPWAHFPRTFPRNNFERVVNFVKFNIVEPLLPVPPAN